MQYTKKEQEIIEQSIIANRMMNLNSLMGLSEDEGRLKILRDVDRAISTSKDSGYYYLPERFGDLIFIDNPNVDSFAKKVISEIHRKIPFLYADGVRDQDIREWWNLNDVERVFMQQQDFGYRMSAILYSVENDDMNFDQAVKSVNRRFVSYGDSTLNFGDPNRPIPLELKNRILTHDEQWRLSHGMIDNHEALEFSSYNSYIRNEIRRGKL